MAIEVATDSLGTYVNPSLGDLERLVEELGESNTFVIVTRPDRPDQFAQTLYDAKRTEDRYVVEYRDGPHSQWQAFTSDAGVVVEVLSGWAFERPGWRDVLAWARLDLGF